MCFSDTFTWNIMMQIMTDHDFSWNPDGFSHRWLWYVTINHDSPWNIKTLSITFRIFHDISLYLMIYHDVQWNAMMKKNVSITFIFVWSLHRVSSDDLFWHTSANNANVIVLSTSVKHQWLWLIMLISWLICMISRNSEPSPRGHQPIWFHCIWPDIYRS